MDKRRAQNRTSMAKASRSLEELLAFHNYRVVTLKLNLFDQQVVERLCRLGPGVAASGLSCWLLPVMTPAPTRAMPNK